MGSDAVAPGFSTFVEFKTAHVRGRTRDFDQRARPYFEIRHGIFVLNFDHGPLVLAREASQVAEIRRLIRIEALARDGERVIIRIALAMNDSRAWKKHGREPESLRYVREHLSRIAAHDLVPPQAAHVSMHASIELAHPRGLTILAMLSPPD